MRLTYLFLTLLSTGIVLSGCTRSEKAKNSVLYRQKSKKATSLAPPLAPANAFSAIRLAIAHASAFDVISLDPTPSPAAQALPTRFHSWPEYGRVHVADSQRLRKLIDALSRELENADSLSACFYPRHAVRIIVDPEPIDLLICYDCSEIQAYRGDHYIGVLRATGTAKAPMNVALDQAHIPRAQGWGSGDR